MEKIKCNISRVTATTIVVYFHIVLNAMVALIAIKILSGEESCVIHSDFDYSAITRTVCTRHSVPEPVAFFCSVFLIACTAGVVLGIVMLIGIFKKSHELMAPFVYFGAVGLIGSSIMWIILIIVYISVADNLNGIPYILPICVVMEALQYALWYPAHRLYVDLKEKANGTLNGNNTEYETLIANGHV